jgi:hypothetical protein
MKDGPKERLREWREEIEEELGAARKELAECESERKTAAAEADEAEADYKTMEAVIHQYRGDVTPGLPLRDLAPPLSLRFAAHQAWRDAARGRLQRAHGRRKGAVLQVAALERSLQQIDAIVGAAAEEQAPSPAEAA